MYKDIMISLLGAWILRDAFGTTEVREQTAIVMGLAAVLFIFLLFLEKVESRHRTNSKIDAKIVEFAEIKKLVLYRKWKNAIK